MLCEPSACSRGLLQLLASCHCVPGCCYCYCYYCCVPPEWPPPTPRLRPQDKFAARAAKALSRAECEAAVQALLMQDVLRVDLGFTAYATNSYLKAGQRAAALLAVRAVAARCQ